MSRREDDPPSSTEEILERIYALQAEISEREEKIARLVEAADDPAPLTELMEDGEERRKLRQLERLFADWDKMVAVSRVVADDDLDLVAALVRFVGDLLIIQPEGVGEKWIEGLEEYLRLQRATVN